MATFEGKIEIVQEEKKILTALAFAEEFIAAKRRLKWEANREVDLITKNAFGEFKKRVKSANCIR